MHSYYTSVVDKSGSVPQTVIRAENYDGGERWERDGDPIRLTIKQLLNISGVDLDKRLDEQPNGQGLDLLARDDETVPYPYARLSGVTLIMTFKYYTRALAPRRYKWRSGEKAGDTICIVEVTPQYTWSSQASDIQQSINYTDDPFFINPERERRPENATEPLLEGIQVDYQRNGIELRFKITGQTAYHRQDYTKCFLGNMGRFEFFCLVNAVITGAVLLGFAQIAISYVAIYGLGVASTLYAEHMEEPVNWRKDYARFAVHSLVAGMAFRRLDDDGSGTLDRQEIYKHLAAIFQGERENSQILSLDEVACLADFFLRHRRLTDGNGGLEEQSEAVRSSCLVSRRRISVSQSSGNVEITTVDMADWIDTFTEEKVQISSLTRLVKSEYNDPKTIEILLALAQVHRVKHRGRTVNCVPEGTGASHWTSSNDLFQI